MIRLLMVISLLGATAAAQEAYDETETMIEAILAAERAQRAVISDVTFDAEFVEGVMEDGVLNEEVRVVKKVFVKYLQDTAWFAEDFLEYYYRGELQDSAATAREEVARLKQRLKRNGRDISFPVLKPFHPEMRERYDIAYVGTEPDVLDSSLCHHLRVTARERERDLIDGDFYFDTRTFHLVRAEFSPAKLPGGVMFSMKRLSMVLTQTPTADGWWLPSRFDVSGVGRAALFVGVRFAVTEYYRNPRLNSGLSDEIFEEYYEQR